MPDTEKPRSGGTGASVPVGLPVRQATSHRWGDKTMPHRYCDDSPSVAIPISEFNYELRNVQFPCRSCSALLHFRAELAANATALLSPKMPVAPSGSYLDVGRQGEAGVADQPAGKIERLEKL